MDKGLGEGVARRGRGGGGEEGSECGGWQGESGNWGRKSGCQEAGMMKVWERLRCRGRSIQGS